MLPIPSPYRQTEASRHGRIQASSKQLCSLIIALILLQILRMLILCHHLFHFSRLPGSLISWIDGTENRIFNIIPSLLTQDTSRPRVSKLSNSDEQILTMPREDRSSDNSPLDQAVDSFMAPNTSSQQSSESSEEFRNRDKITQMRYHFLASQSKYPRGAHYTKSAMILPTYTGMSARAVRLSANLDGAPIMPPPTPAYLSRMPYSSVSDSFYSLNSNGPHGHRHILSTSSSMKGSVPVAPYIYTDLLPKRPFLTSTSKNSQQCSIPHKIRRSSIFRSDLTSLAEGMGQCRPSGSISSYPGNFPVRDGLEYSSLATVSQYVVNGEYMKVRPLSAPVPRFERTASTK